jgi:uncharacterized protein
MNYDLLRIATWLVSGFVAGSINSVAGGGGLVVFPALLASGMSLTTANATNAVALVPGLLAAFVGYRDHLRGDRHFVAAMAVPSVVGGAAGAVLALHVGELAFARVVPWLVLLATVLFASQEPLLRALGTHTAQADKPSPRKLLTLSLFQLTVAFYGGFFGAGIGIIMLAALSLMGVRDVHRANGLKSLAAVCINAVASIAFIASNRVEYGPAAAIATGAIVGGYGGAGIARRIGQKTVRRIVMGVGASLAVALFVRALRSH